MRTSNLETRRGPSPDRARPRTFRAAGLALVCVCLFAGLAGSQEFRSNLTGQVTDASGGIIPNASVTAVMTNTGQTYTAKTSSDGVYYIPYVLPGTYVVTVKARGFRTAIQHNVLVLAAQSYAVNFRLEVGPVTQTVAVTSTPPIIDTASGSGSDVLQARAISSLPLNGRTVFMLIQATPGNSFTTTEFGNTGGTGWPDDWSNESSYQIGGNATVAGAFNNFTLNGVNVTNMYAPGSVEETGIGAWMVAPNVDALQEVNVQTQTYDARYGRTGGGVVNMVVKSGTNAFHGDVYEYDQNGAFDAATFTDNLTGLPKEDYKVNEFGGTFGGPIKKDKIFFFGSLEGQLVYFPITVLTSVPTAAMRDGDFSGTINTIYNPATTVCTVAGGTLGDCSGNKYASTEFPNDTIPQADINKTGADLANLFPMPNINVTSYEDNFVDMPTAINRTWQPMARLDYNLTDNTRLYSFFLWEGGFADKNSSGFSGAAQEGNVNQGRNTIVATQDLTHIFSPTLVGDFKAGYARTLDYIGDGDFAAQEGPASLGLSYPIAGNAAYPNLDPQITFSGTYPQIIGNTLDGGTNTNIVFDADFTKSKGRHNIEFGGEYGDYVTTELPGGSANGAFEFGTCATQYNPITRDELPGITDGNPIADTLLGDPESGSVAWNTSVDASGPMWDLYAQDNIRVSHRLTLNVGLRYDVERGLRERFNRENSGFCLSCVNSLTNNSTYQANLAADASSWVAYGLTSAEIASLSTLYGGITFPSESGSSADVYDTDWDNIGPRIGFAYMITPKTVVRGGWGWLYGYTDATPTTDGFSISTPYTASLNGVTPDGYFSSGHPFPSGLDVPTGSSQGLLTNIGNSADVPFYGQKIPRMQIMSLGVERQLPGDMLLDVKYAGNYARNLDEDWYPSADFSLSGGPMSGSICGLSGNVGFPQLQQSTYDSCVGTWYSSTVPNPFYGVVPASSSLGASKTISASNLLRGYPEFNGTEDEAMPIGKSWYDSLQVSVEKRLYGQTRGLSFEFGYVYSRALQSDGYADTGPWQTIPLYEDAEYDRTNMVTATGEWDLPVGRGAKYILPNPSKVLSEFVSGWRLGGVFTAGSGFPEAIAQGDWNTPGYSYMPPGGPTFGEWLNNCNNVPTNCFLTKPAEAQSGTGASEDSQINYLREPITPDLDLSLTKNFPITESKYIQFRVDAFNFTNTPFFPPPDDTYTDGPAKQEADGEWEGFGTVSFNQYNYARLVEFALKLYF
jgi:hypothetical protein